VKVAHSSPLILYGRIGRLDLLQALFQEVLISPAVYAEVVERGTGRSAAPEVAQATWIRMTHLSRLVARALFATSAGAGEVEAIALAEERGLTLLIDDRADRTLAARHGVPIVGSAGVLVVAKRRSLLGSVKSLLDALIASGLRLNPALYQQVLSLAGE
jgi:uncharacterized protein